MGGFAQQDASEKGTKAATFDFLGFTHYCSTNKSGKFRVKRKTSRKKFKKKCKENVEIYTGKPSYPNRYAHQEAE